MTDALQKFREVVKYVTKSRAKYIQIAYTKCYTIRIIEGYSCAGTLAFKK